MPKAAGRQTLAGSIEITIEGPGCSNASGAALYYVVVTNPKAPVQNLLLIGAGGAIGALLRYGLSGLAYRWLGETFPWGTLLVNVIGCFLIGVLWALSERAPMAPAVRIFLMTGTLGAFTTFSTYGLESINLLRDGEVALALANILGSNIVGLGAVVLGFFLVRFSVGGGS